MDRGMHHIAKALLGASAAAMALAGLAGAFVQGGPGTCPPPGTAPGRATHGTACGLQAAPGADQGAALALALGMGMGNGPAVSVPGVAVDRKLTVESVKRVLSARLAIGGNPRLRLGEVRERDSESILAEIVTVDKALVDRFVVDRKSGRFTRI